MLVNEPHKSENKNEEMNVCMCAAICVLALKKRRIPRSVCSSLRACHYFLFEAMKFYCRWLVFCPTMRHFDISNMDRNLSVQRFYNAIFIQIKITGINWNIHSKHERGMPDTSVFILNFGFLAVYCLFDVDFFIITNLWECSIIF